jgi:hypothetical protein
LTIRRLHLPLFVRNVAIGIIGLVILGACYSRPEEPSESSVASPTAAGSFPIETDRSSYLPSKGEFGPEVTIMARYTSAGTAPVYIANCNGAIASGLQMKVGEQWIDAWMTATNSCLSGPIVLNPGDEQRDTMLVRPNAGAVLYPRDRGERLHDGTYRVVWYGVVSTYEPAEGSLGTELPLERRVSAPFTISWEGAD